MSAAAGGSRRRAALLEGRTESQEKADLQPRLSLADVERLQDGADASARASVAAKLGMNFQQLAAGDATRSLAYAVLHLLVRDVEKTVRSALAEAVALSDALPPAIANKLAQDDIEVARPILEHSPVLDDDLLIEIVRTHAMQYALAVAGRQNVAARVCEALVETGEGEVVARLVGNETSRLSQATLERIIDDYGEDQEVQARMVRRPELPYELVDQLVGMIGRRLQWELVSSRQISGEDAKRLVAAVRDQTAISMTARDHNARRALADLREEHQEGSLDPMSALEALRDGQIARFEGIMALLSGQDLPVVRRLLYGMDKRSTAALCLRAGFGTSHYLAIRMALDFAQSGMTAKGQHPTFSADTLRFIQAQYERMRSQPEVIKDMLSEAVRAAKAAKLT